MPLATEARMKAVLSQVGFISQGDDDGDGVVSTTEELEWVSLSLKSGDDEVYKRLLKRYTSTIIQASGMACRFAAVLAAATFCRHRGDSVPESLQEWADEVRMELDAIRKKEMDLQAGDEGELASERSAALPLLINQGFDPRYQRPSRRQVNQSTRRRSTKPYSVDYRDSNGFFQ